MKLIGFLQQYNENTYGNLRRCLENLSRYCDEIAVYDDGSTDDSLDVVREFTDLIIEGGVNDFLNETTHKQRLLGLALTRSPDYLVWLDADEVFDRGATEGGLRRLCETGKSWTFFDVTPWRSQTWHRLDVWEGANQPRLWKTTEGMQIPRAHGLHRQLYPDGLDLSTCRDHRVIHYGFSSKEAIERRWRARTAHGMPIEDRRHSIDEREMQLERLPPERFPPGIDVPTGEPKPESIRYAEDIMAEAGL